MTRALLTKALNFIDDLDFADPDAARAFLVKAGILTPKGNLRKAFGG